MTEFEYIYLCLKSAGISNRTVLKIEETFGDIREIININKERLSELDFLTEGVIYRFLENRKYDKIDRLYDNMYKKGISFVHIHHKDYPQKLENIPDMPYGLFYKSNLPDKSPSVAIVGARDADEYGNMLAYKMARVLAANKVNVISGLALGVDNSAHRGALSGGGKTFALMACGADICYPRSNIDTYVSMLDNGGIISEYLPGTPPMPHHFPVRNRLISGLSDVVVLIEAKEKSGSLITIDQALEQSREVFVVPGRITDEMSKGCNMLIKQGANILLDVSELLEFLSIRYNTELKNTTKNEFMLARDEKIVYSVLDLYPKALEEILDATKLEYTEVLRILFDLSAKGIIRETTKNYYMKVF